MDVLRDDDVQQVVEIDEQVVVGMHEVLVRQEIAVVCHDDEGLDEQVVPITDKIDEMVDHEYVVIEVEVDEVLPVNEIVQNDIDRTDDETDEQGLQMPQMLQIVDEVVDELFVICHPLVIPDHEMVDHEYC